MACRLGSARPLSESMHISIIYIYMTGILCWIFNNWKNMSNAETWKCYLLMQKVPSGPRPKPHGCSWWRCKEWARRHGNNGSRGNDVQPRWEAPKSSGFYSVCQMLLSTHVQLIYVNTMLFMQTTHHYINCNIVIVTMIIMINIKEGNICIKSGEQTHLCHGSSI